MSFSIRTILIAAVAAGAVSASAKADDSTSRTTISNPNNCKVVERQPGERVSGSTMSTTVTAGNGQVSASTNAPNAVTVHSGNGSATSSSVTTGSSSGGGQTTVTTSNGDCVIYVNPGEKKDK